MAVYVICKGEAVATATLGYDKESPQQKFERLLGASFVKTMQDTNRTWSKEDGHVIRACIKYLVYGTEAEESRCHPDPNHLRFNRLTKAHNDILYCCYLEVIWEEPLLSSAIVASKTATPAS
jgi:hypothetical protein